MSIYLNDAKDDNLILDVTAKGPFGTIVSIRSINPEETKSPIMVIDLEKSIELVEYLILNSNIIGDNDPRISFLNRIKEYKIVDGFGGGKRIDF